MMNKLAALSLASLVFAACGGSESDVSLRLWPNTADEVRVTMTGAEDDIPALRAALEHDLGAMKRGSYPVAFADGEPIAILLPPRTTDVLASVLPAIDHAASEAGFIVVADPIADEEPGVARQELNDTLETFCTALSGVMTSCAHACSASLNTQLADLYKRICDDFHTGPHWHID